MCDCCLLGSSLKCVLLTNALGLWLSFLGLGRGSELWFQEWEGLLLGIFPVLKHPAGKSILPGQTGSCVWGRGGALGTASFWGNFCLSQMLHNMKGQFAEHLLAAGFVNSRNPKDPKSNTNSGNWRERESLSQLKSQLAELPHLLCCFLQVMRSCSKRSSVLASIPKWQRSGPASAKRGKCEGLVESWFVFKVFSTWHNWARWSSGLSAWMNLTLEFESLPLRRVGLLILFAWPYAMGSVKHLSGTALKGSAAAVQTLSLVVIWEERPQGSAGLSLPVFSDSFCWFWFVFVFFEGWRFAPRQMDQLISIPSQWMWRKQSSIITGSCTTWRWGPAVWVGLCLWGFCFIFPFWRGLDQGSEGMWTAFVLGHSLDTPSDYVLYDAGGMVPQIMNFWGLVLGGFIEDGIFKGLAVTSVNSFILVYFFFHFNPVLTLLNMLTFFPLIVMEHLVWFDHYVKDWKTWDHFCPCSIWFHVTFFELSCFMHLQNLWVTE